MQVAKWGKSLAVRLPANVVQTLQLQAGDQIEIQVGERVVALEKSSKAEELVKSLRLFRGRLPKDFRFDQIEARARR